VELRTREHLATAERNRVIAALLLDPSTTAAIQPQPREWAAVLAFYAAVHLVNALLWERLRYAPRDHADRRRMIGSLAELRPHRRAYGTLQQHGYRARYTPGYRIGPVDAQSLLDAHLLTVEHAVYAALGIPSSQR
jgi:hypothetical protein